MTAEEWFHKLWQTRARRDAIVVSALGVVSALALIATPWWLPSNFVGTLELRTIDLRFNWRGPQPPAPEVVIVGIDENSFVADTFNGEELRANPELKLLSSWPWPRKAHALLLGKLLAAGAKMVAFDLLFTTPSIYGPEDDAAWRAALEKGRGRVVIGANRVEDRDPVHGTMREKWMMPTASVLPDSVPMAELCAAVNYMPDPDLVIRQFGPRWPTTEQGQFITAFPLKAALACDPAAKWAFDLPRIYINHPGPKKTFPTHPYWLVFNAKGWERNLQRGAVFKDKIVLVGPTQNFLHDVHPTPFEQDVPGVEIHAAAIGTLLKRNNPCPSHIAVEPALVLLFTVGAVLSLLTIRHPLFKLVPPLVLAAIYTGICHLAFTKALLILPLAAPVVVLAPTAVFGIAWQLLTEQFERRRARAALERQVSKEVADELMKEYGALQLLLAPQERHLVVFFSDIRNFTTIFEKGNPQTLIGLLNEYLSAMSLVVNRHGGTLDKYIGDAIMAFWGAPTSRGPQEDALRAVSAALEMRKELAVLQRQWAEKEYPEIKIGVGIHAGAALVGEVGSQQRSEYTAIGDTVNTASRIEGVNKETGTDILISGTVYELVKDRIKARPMGEHALKGKAGHVTLHAVEGAAENPSPAAR